MYNSIYPININYRKHNQQQNKGADLNSDEKKSKIGYENSSTKNSSGQINGYPKGEINISQVLTDFKNTTAAINAPKDVQEEVNLYLSLVEKESKKENPSRDIILSNLKNASKISDAYISQALKRPSDVVQNWIDTLFQHKINLKSDPGAINPDFLLKFPKKQQVNPQEQDIKQAAKQKEDTPVFISDKQIEIIPPDRDYDSYKNNDEVKFFNSYNSEKIKSESKIELSQNEEEVIAPRANFFRAQVPQNHAVATPFSPRSEADIKARGLFSKARRTPEGTMGDTDKLNLLNESLGILDSSEDNNPNIQAAIHLERGKLFDNYDYVDYALRDYFEATKANDLNLKAQAFYRLGQIYDEFIEFSPALDNYLSSVAYSGEAENYNAQTRVLSRIASLYAKQFDLNNTLDYSSLALDSAYEADNEELLAQTYSKNAQNYQYLGEDDKALDGYKNALEVFSNSANESYEQMAYNYEQAAKVMKKLGNYAKADKLQAKANLYFQKALLQEENLA